MPRKKKIMDSVVFNNGGSKTMIKPDERAKIRRLVLDEHRPIREVARMLEISRNAIRRCVREDPSATFERKSSNGKFLSEHQKDIRDLYEKCELRCPPLQRLIKEQYGIDISLRMLERFCADIRQEHRLERLQADVPIRYETAPGQHMQVDFGEKDVLVNGQPSRLHFFVAKLCYSRRVFAKAYFAETQAAWIDGMESAFRYFGGLSYCIVCDIASSLVRNHYAKDASARFTERFYQFCTYYNLKGIATAVRKPRSKGKVESGVNYVKSNLAGVDKSDLAAWNLWLEKWCLESYNRRLSTVFEGELTPKRRWLMERPKLRRCTQPSMCRCFIESRKVGKDGLIRIENKYYKVANNLVGLEVQVQIDESTITVMKGKQPVATLNKTADGFNPKQQVTSTGDPINDAFQKKTAELLNDQQWQAFQKSSNELGADGFQYDEAIGWTARGEQKWA